MIRAAPGWPDRVDAISRGAQSVSGPLAERLGRARGAFPKRRGPAAGSPGYSIPIEPLMHRLFGGGRRAAAAWRSSVPGPAWWQVQLGGHATEGVSRRWPGSRAGTRAAYSWPERAGPACLLAGRFR